MLRPIVPAPRPSKPAGARVLTPAPVAEGPTPPAVAREFRGAWLATVKNIDWPSRPGLSVPQMKAELVAMLDRAQALGLNAVVMQVRPAGDALYASAIEPWSQYLTGKEGQAPADGFDPLAFAVEQAHARGLELHAWVNPFRARLLDREPSVQPSGLGGILARLFRRPAAEAGVEADPQHVTQTHPEWVRRYGSYQWLDPGEPLVQDYVMRVVRDVVQRYDVDGVHIDDYFYPYPVQGPNGKDQPFPDDATYRRYQQGGGTLARDDWRRDNVDRFVERLYKEVRAEKPHVRVGVSPFGIWKPGNPPGITGMDPTEKLYADARKWLQAGWLDYLAPQLYWPLESTGQPFAKLLAWWQSQNTQGRHMWPGMFTSKVADGSASAWKADQIRRQVEAARQAPGVTGHAHYSVRPLLSGRGGLYDLLASRTYTEPALVPASPWLDADGKPPGRATVTLAAPDARGRQAVTWAGAGDEPVARWLVQLRENGAWRSRVLDGDTRTLTLDAGVDAVAVTPLDRAGVAGAPTSLALPAPARRDRQG
ncbi:MAG: family 10 glycosylhydrolase [Candidatus Sericytochromatia bacterium]|nr:family 10 glycosylhydrolase [Candidatus Sericytochromatia bacterium]